MHSFRCFEPKNWKGWNDGDAGGGKTSKKDKLIVDKFNKGA